MNRPENDSLDAFLRDQNHYLEDNGFTARVLTALPKRRSAWWLRLLLLLVTTTIGSALAILWLPWRNLAGMNLRSLLSLNSQILLPAILIVTVVASLIWGIIAAVQLED